MREYPELSDELRGQMTEDELNDLWNMLLIELLNPVWMNRKHYNRRTHDAGCRGPMCRKAVREYARRRNGTSPSGRYARLDAILTIWFPTANRVVQEAKMKILSDLVPEV